MTPGLRRIVKRKFCAMWTGQSWTSAQYVIFGTHPPLPYLTPLQLFNQYADSASYYDICLQIFYLADYRNAADIKSTWQHLIQDLHDATVESGTSPLEAVIDKVRSLGSRLRLSETVFPIRELVPLLERYSLEHQRYRSSPHWVIDLFLTLGVPHESLYGVLEAIYYNDEAPFHGSNRRIIGADLVYLLEVWLAESSRPGGIVYGSEAMAARVSEALLLVRGGGGSQDVVDRAQYLLRMIAERVG